MPYFNYHAKIKRLINQGKLTSYYFDNNHNKIGFCLVLCFDGQKYPIREKCFETYFNLIGKLYSTTKVEGVFFTTFKNNQ